MKLFKKHISVLLLLVFSCLLIPSSLLHIAFAEHEDTVCDWQHEKGMVSVEALHTHCDMFTTNAPLYDVPELVVFKKPLRVLLSEFKPGVYIAFYGFTRHLLSARAPPIA